ncbi:MAG TPA: PAS domain S-box protein, partial [Pirellula sp.]|nr:PAS domain S-box protein [Pirellula sp.]
LVDSIEDYAIYMLDPNGFVTSWNSGAQRIKGYSAEEIVGEHFSRFYTSDDNHINKPKQNLDIAAVNGRYEDESLRVRKNGSIFWANVLITAIRDDSGNLTGFAKVVRDITARKESDQRVRDSERLAVLGTSAAVFAHEIANPLNGLATCLEIVTSSLDETDYQNPLVRETIHGANQEIQRLTSLLKDYRTLARPQTINIQPSNLRRIVDEVLTPNIKSFNLSGVTVRFEFEGGLPPVPVDSQKIKQVILNLCKNAVDAMRDGGELIIKAYQSTDSVILEFSDMGVGIPDGFDPFHLFKTTKPEGTGLGLPIVQQIISDHHGTVDYVSEVGKGSTFRVSLPLVQTMYSPTK